MIIVVVIWLYIDFFSHSCRARILPVLKLINLKIYFISLIFTNEQENFFNAKLFETSAYIKVVRKENVTMQNIHKHLSKNNTKLQAGTEYLKRYRNKAK